jgi:hypothetical protein
MRALHALRGEIQQLEHALHTDDMPSAVDLYKICLPKLEMVDESSCSSSSSSSDRRRRR